MQGISKKTRRLNELDIKVLLLFQKEKTLGCAGVWRRVFRYTYSDCRRTLKRLCRGGYIREYQRHWYFRKWNEKPEYYWVYQITPKGEEFF